MKIKDIKDIDTHDLKKVVLRMYTVISNYEAAMNAYKRESELIDNTLIAMQSLEERINRVMPDLWLSCKEEI